MRRFAQHSCVARCGMNAARLIPKMNISLFSDETYIIAFDFEEASKLSNTFLISFFHVIMCW